MTYYPIETARHFAEGLGFPVLTADVPAISAAVHRHYALGQRDAAPRIAAAVLAEREACAQLCDAHAFIDSDAESAGHAAEAIRARGTPC